MYYREVNLTERKPADDLVSYFAKRIFESGHEEKGISSGHNLNNPQIAVKELVWLEPISSMIPNGQVIERLDYIQSRLQKYFDCMDEGTGTYEINNLINQFKKELSE